MVPNHARYQAALHPVIVCNSDLFIVNYNYKKIKFVWRKKFMHNKKPFYRIGALVLVAALILSIVAVYVL